jgi:hypothetical protein
LAAHSIKIRDLLRAKSKYSDVGGHQVILQKAFRGTVPEIQGTINSGQVNVNFVGASGLRAIDYACVAENAPVIEFLKKHESFDTLISGFRSMVRSGDHHDIVININVSKYTRRRRFDFNVEHIPGSKNQGASNVAAFSLQFLPANHWRV